MTVGRRFLTITSLSDRGVPDLRRPRRQGRRLPVCEWARGITPASKHAQSERRAFVPPRHRRLVRLPLPLGLRRLLVVAGAGIVIVGAQGGFFGLLQRWRPSADNAVVNTPETVHEPSNVELCSIRVGTWNVQSATVDRNAARLAWMLTLDCDLWVLTETNDDLALPEPFKPIHSEPRPTARKGGRLVTICSRLPATRLPTEDPVRTVAAQLNGGTIVFGTVLPWHTDPGPTPDRAKPLRSWEEFQRVTPLQGGEWRALRGNHAGKLLVIAGDLNQSLGATRYYESPATRQLLCDCFHAADLTCLTDGDHLPEEFKAIPLIDHVCAAAPAGAAVRGVDWVVWDGGGPDGTKLSDHSGVAVTVRNEPFKPSPPRNVRV